MRTTSEIRGRLALGDEDEQQRADTVYKQHDRRFILKMNGTSTDAPNIANICWMDSGTSRRGGTFSST